MKIVFMGTPAFALPSLQRLVHSPHHVVAAVTVPDKPVGRGLRLRFSPVKEMALRYSLPVLQPESLNDGQFLENLESFKADIFVVVAFRILPAAVFEMPRQKAINLHASLLPKYRGAAPINWAVINGEKETGVSTIVIAKSVDTGDLLLQQRVNIGDEETAGELHDRLAETGADLLAQSIDGLENGMLVPTRQMGEATRAPKLSRELCEIDWAASALQVRNLIRGLSPAPGAFSHLRGRLVKFFAAEISAHPADGTPPGQVVFANPKSGELCVATGAGSLLMKELQPEGKRRMSARDFLLGYKMKAEDHFGKK